MVKVKGKAIYSYKNFIQENHDISQVSLFKSKIREETRSFLESAILSDKWYELSLVEDLLDNYQKMFGNKMLYKMSLYALESTQKGLFGFVARFLSAKKIISNLGYIWSRYYDQGKMELLSYTDDSVSLKVSGLHLSNGILYGMMYYAEILVRRYIWPEVISSYERIDGMNTVFTYTKVI